MAFDHHAMTIPEIATKLGVRDPFIQSISMGTRPLEVLRLDEMHPIVQGNKWFKLAYNLLSIQENGYSRALSFGGAYSNHLHAFSYACHVLGIPCIGMIRGEEPMIWSPTLLDARKWGMQLEFIQRDAYADKDTDDFKAWIRQTYGDVYIIPEGGAHFLGVNGCMEIAQWIPDAVDWICCSAGTGTMAAGLLLRLKAHQKLMVFPAVKGEEYMRHEIKKHLYYFLMDEEIADEFMRDKLVIVGEYHFGGYAKKTELLMEYIADFEEKTGIPLEHVYTGKLFYGIENVLGQHAALHNKRVLAIHSGGLQGNRSIAS
ncbi:MAG: 1-aminocyclopropane-1-carboxylate deaminase/D-cysteine desulfhydrase [Flavobacteriales bacterium]